MGISVNDLKHVAKTVLGCVLEDDGDHIRYSLIVNEKIIATFKYSHSWRGNTQIGEPILHKQAQSMHCSLQTWKGLIQGRIPKQQYFQELLQKGLINQAEFEMLCE
jgi:hypothetical protein